MVVAGAALATALLPQRADSLTSGDGANIDTAPALWRDSKMLRTLPAILAAPFIGTGFFFHQARLAQEKDWSLSWLAGWFAAYAIAQAATNVLAGPLIDRLRPARMLPFFLAPMAGAMLALYFSSTLWTAPVFLILVGVSSGIAGTLATALWVDLYGPERLARVRSTVEAGLIVASGASPALFGLLLDRGVPLGKQALGCFVYIVIASALTIGVAIKPAEA